MLPGCLVWYRHERLGWVRAILTQVNPRGSSRGGDASIVMVADREGEGEVETTLGRLSLTRPKERPEEPASPPGAQAPQPPTSESPVETAPSPERLTPHGRLPHCMFI